jgi:hypothetical protein
MTNIGDSFGWAFKDPQWFSKFLLIGLIGLIPIVGWINLTGWMLASADNLRRGYLVLPPANLSYLGRGIGVALSLFIYYLVVTIPTFFLFFALVGASIAAQANGFSSTFGTGFFPLFQLLSLALSLIAPAIILNADHGGIGAGLNVGRVLGTFASRPGPALIAGIIYIAAGWIGSIGLLACCIGIIVTIPYGQSIVAGVVTSYERELGWPPPQHVAPAPTQFPPPPPPAAPA